MRKLPIRIAVAVITLLLGLMLSSVLKHLRRAQPPQEQSSIPALTPSPVPAQFVNTGDDDNYPDTLGLQPFEIEWFIDNHPKARLSRLWERLNVKVSNPVAREDLASCERCSAESFYYDLDQQPGDEVLLRVGDELAANWRYLVFKQTPKGAGWKLLGSIDVRDKYEPVRHLVLASEGKPYVILTELSANGSGLALYQNRVYQVSENGIKEVASYLGSGYLFGEADYYPSLAFNTHVLSCSVQGNRTVAKVEYVFEYSETNLILFSQRKRVVLTNLPLKKRRQSDGSDYESESLSFINSMTGSDFLKYNYSELLNLANRGNSAQKRWLKNYLETCDNGVEKRRLFAALLK